MKVLAFENILSYAPIRVRIVSTGQMLVHKRTISAGASIQAGTEEKKSPGTGGRDEHPKLSHDLKGVVS